MNKLCFIDVETTGLKPDSHGIVQIAGIIDINGEEKESFDLRCKPFQGDLIDTKALEVNSLSMDTIASYPPPQETYKKLTAILSKYVDKFNKKDKFFFVGYNCATFDAPFVRAFFEKNGDKYFGSFFWFPVIDVAILAGHLIGADRKNLERFNLESVAGYFGLTPPGSWHDATTDIKVTRDLYNVLATAGTKIR